MSRAASACAARASNVICRSALCQLSAIAMRYRWLAHRLQLLAHGFFMPFALTCCATIASERPLIEGRGGIATSSRDFRLDDNNRNSSNNETATAPATVAIIPIISVTVS
jgi:hypothetical protein